MGKFVRGWQLFRHGILFSAAIMLIGCGIAQAGEVSVRLGGTAYNGGPAFRLVLGGTVVGEGTVENVDGQDFSFNVSDDILSLNQDLRITLTNDAFVDVGGDRNLRIIGAIVGNSTLSPANFDIYRVGQVDPITSSSGMLFGNNDYGLAQAPDTGWIDPARPLPQPSEPAPVSEAPPVNSVATPAPSVADAAPGACDAKGLVASFPIGTAQISENLFAGLPEILRQAQGNCAVTITGFASSSGSASLNQRISEERAEAVLQFLLAKGAKFTAHDVLGAGATNQFGAQGNENRRVQITVHP